MAKYADSVILLLRMGALRGCFLKLDRAKEHLDCLEAKQERFLSKERPYGFWKQYDPKTSCVIFTTQELDDLPEDWGIILGDYVHNVRSALDHLAWELACKNLGRKPTGKPRREISFPIETSHANFMNSSVLRHVAFEHVAFFERQQPYPGRQENHSLRVLHDLWNDDKHRVVAVLRVSVHSAGPLLRAVPGVAIVDQWFNIGAELKTGTKIACAKLAGGQIDDSSVDMEVFPGDIAFGKRRVKFETLPHMSATVERIVRECEETFFH